MTSVNVSSNGSSSPTKCVGGVVTDKSIITPSTELTNNDHQEDSLQQLIESELALRIGTSAKTPPEELLVGLQQTDFFSTTQYESPSEEVPPSTGGDPFDPFSTTIEQQSPTFPGFSEDEIKGFNKDPYCEDLLSPQTEINPFCDTISSQANVDILANLSSINETIDLSPSPPENHTNPMNTTISNNDSILELTNSNELLSQNKIMCEVTEEKVDLLNETIDLSPSPPPDINNEKQKQLDFEEEMSSIKQLDQTIDLINETIDLSPTPPQDVEGDLEGDKSDDVQIISSLNRTIDLLNETITLDESTPDVINQIDCIDFDSEQNVVVDPLNQTIDLSPSPPEMLQEEPTSDLIQDPIYQTYDLSPSPPTEGIVADVEIVITEASEAQESTTEEMDASDTILEEIEPPETPPAEDSPMTSPSSPPEEFLPQSPPEEFNVDQQIEDPQTNEDIPISPPKSPADSSASPPKSPPESPSKCPKDESPIPLDSDLNTFVVESIQKSSEVEEEEILIKSCEPIDCEPELPQTEPLEIDPPKPEPTEVETMSRPVDMFGPLDTALEIGGFESWTVAGAEEEEEEAPPLQKSLLPERPTTLVPHVVCADTTNLQQQQPQPSVGCDELGEGSEELTTPSSESSPVKKKTSKKTKSSAGDGKKKSKKTKKSEEKENISVAGMQPPELLLEIQTSPRILRSPDDTEERPVRGATSPMTLVPKEELGNVSVKNLSLKFVRGPKATRPRTELDDLDTVPSLRALREMYISEASKSYSESPRPADTTESRASVQPISLLRRSFGDLSTLTDDDASSNNRLSDRASPTPVDIPCSPMTARHKQHSYGTLPLPKSPKVTQQDRRVSVSDTSTTNLLDGRTKSFSDLSKAPSAVDDDIEAIFSGVSVRALRASFSNAGHQNQLLRQGDKDKPSPPPSVSSTPLPFSPPSTNNNRKSSFSKFDAMSRKSTVLHVRSSDAAKAQEQFSQDNFPLYALLDEHDSPAGGGDPSAAALCRSCGSQVFQMEQVKAEKGVWHKNCFRCKECSKQLTVDTYSSHEGQLFCKPHFKELFKPKAVPVEEPSHLRHRRPEMIIRENQPAELPPDVVRASDKPDLGLEELAAMNVKSRYQVFEKSEDSGDLERSPSNVNVKRSPSILSKLARFQAKGMDVGVTDDSLNGIPFEESSSSEGEEDEGEEEEGEGEVVRARVKKERPPSFGKMDDVRSMWATGQAQRREEQREERREEVQKLRSRLFMGKQRNMKEMYEQAVQESAETKVSSPQRAPPAEMRSDKARSIKERFEKGEPLVSDSEDQDEQSRNARQEDLSVFEAACKPPSAKHNYKSSAVSKPAVRVYKAAKPSAGKVALEHEPLPEVSQEQQACPASAASISAEEEEAMLGDGISKKSRSLFLELDSAAAKSQQQSPMSQSTTPRTPQVQHEPRRNIAKEWLNRQPSQEVVRSNDRVEDVQVETADICSRFKFFEGYREPEKERKKFRITPPREGQVKEDSPDRPLYRDPAVVRAEDRAPLEEEVVRSQTASRMLNLFRQMEENAGKDDVPEGPKPLKRFTPPPDYRKGDSGSECSEEEESDEEGSEDEESEEESRPVDPSMVRASDKVEDDFLKQAMSANAARAKALRAKFEKWESSQPQLNGQERIAEEGGFPFETDEEREGRDSLESTSSLRARFESMNAQPVLQRPLVARPKVNRFVVPSVTEECRACGERIYPMERLEAGGNLYHRRCFRCFQCSCNLRLESFTVNKGNLYCLAHYRQLFIAKGSYDEGFGKAVPTSPTSPAT